MVIASTSTCPGSKVPEDKEGGGGKGILCIGAQICTNFIIITTLLLLSLFFGSLMAPGQVKVEVPVI